MRLLIPPLILLSFGLSFVLTLIVKRVAPRFGFVDKPGHRKIHHTPKPLGGGIAIFLAVVLPVLAALVVVHAYTPAKSSDLQSVATYWDGMRFQTPLALKLVGAMLAIHVLGLVDDWRAMGPMSKLIAQLAIITTLVVWADIRALTFFDRYALGKLASIVLTVLWITAITNAFNFLDNMDGLSAGIAAVASTAFLIAALLIGQWFVAAMLAMLLGALLGFLCFNFSPASIFMGDSGSTLIGLLLGVLTIRTTYLLPGKSLGAGWYAVFVPVIVLAIPLYDLIVVSIIRIRNGKSPFVGDTNHLSHRLVRRGMSRRMAVLCIYLMTAATSSAAIVLPHVDTAFAAFVLFGQTFLILGVVAVLEQHPLPEA